MRHAFTEEQRAKMIAEGRNEIHDPGDRIGKRAIDTLSISFGHHDAWAEKKRSLLHNKAA